MKRLRIVLLLCCLLVFVFACSVFNGGNTVSLEKISYLGKTTLDNIDMMYPVALLSPNGMKIAFLNQVEICIYEVEVEENDCHDFGDEFKPDLRFPPVWSPDSRYLAMTEPAYTNMVDADIWIYDTKEQKQTNLTDDNYEGRYLGVDELVEVDFFPSWISDSEIGFLRFITGEDTRESILFKVNVNSDVTEIMDTGFEVPSGIFALSPDGNQFIYTDVTNRGDYYWMDVKTGDKNTLIKDMRGNYIPVFTADQKYVALVINAGLINDAPDMLTFIPLDDNGDDFTYSKESWQTPMFISLSPDSQGALILERNIKENQMILYTLDLEGNQRELKTFDEMFRMTGAQLLVTWSEQNTFLVYSMEKDTYVLFEVGEE